MTRMSQEVLAERLEVGQSYISRLERRDNITLATLVNIVRTLGGSIEMTIQLPEQEPMKFSHLEAFFAFDAQHTRDEQER